MNNKPKRSGIVFSSINVFILMLVTVSTFAVIGVLYSRGKVVVMDDFLTARGTAGGKMLSATLMASFLGVFLLFTPPEAGVYGGLPAIIGYGIGVIGLYLGFIFLSPKIRSYLPKGSTLTDYVHKRYGLKMYVLIVLVMLFYMVVHLIAELTAIGLVANQLADIPLLYTALLVGLATMIYTAYGGLRASIFTDMIQMFLVILLLAGVSIGFVYYLGGFKAIANQVTIEAPQLLSFRNWGGIEYGLTLCIAVFVANLFHQGYWQRIYSGKDNETLRKSLKTAIVIVFPIMLLTGFIGIVAAAYNPAGDPSIALFSLAYSIFPAGLVIALFVLALVLVMSTVDTLLNAIIATFTVDSRRFVKNIDEKFLLKMARVLTVVLIIPIALIASRGYSVLYLFFVADLVCAGVVFPVFYGLYSKECTENIALISSIAGIASGIPFFIAGKLLLSFSVPIVASAAVCLGAIALQRILKVQGENKAA